MELEMVGEGEDERDENDLESWTRLGEHYEHGSRELEIERGGGDTPRG